MEKIPYCALLNTGPENPVGDGRDKRTLYLPSLNRSNRLVMASINRDHSKMFSSELFGSGMNR